ncbi:MAG TPA: T9SS type A sorting domain-containing protein, partial [Bacteroidales bacterium]
PCYDVLNIKAVNEVNSIAIFDITGKQLINYYGNIKSVNVSGLNAGTYIVKISESSGKAFTQRIVKK